MNESCHGIPLKLFGESGPCGLVPASAAFSVSTRFVDNGNLNVCWLCAKLSMLYVHPASSGGPSSTFVISFAVGCSLASRSRVEPSALDTHFCSSFAPSLSRSIPGAPAIRPSSRSSPLEMVLSSSLTYGSILVRGVSALRLPERSSVYGVGQSAGSAGGDGGPSDLLASRLWGSLFFHRISFSLTMFHPSASGSVRPSPANGGSIGPVTIPPLSMQNAPYS